MARPGIWRSTQIIFYVHLRRLGLPIRQGPGNASDLHYVMFRMAGWLYVRKDFVNQNGSWRTC